MMGGVPTSKAEGKDGWMATPSERVRSCVGGRKDQTHMALSLIHGTQAPHGHTGVGQADAAPQLLSPLGLIP